MANVLSMGVGGSKVPPMFCGEVVERQQRVTVLLEAFAGIGVLGTILLQELIERLVTPVPDLGPPDHMDGSRGHRLDTLGHPVEHFGCLVNPATLLASLCIDLAKSMHTTQRSVLLLYRIKSTRSARPALVTRATTQKTIVVTARRHLRFNS